MITLQIIIELGAAGAVAVTVVKCGLKIYDFINHNKEQDEKIERIEQKQERILQELGLTIRGLHATLDGLEQQGCNHTVPKTKEELLNYINDQAHKN